MRFVPGGDMSSIRRCEKKFCAVQGCRVTALVESLAKSKGASMPRER